MKGQALADFLAQHSCLDHPYPFDRQTTYIRVNSWNISFTRAKTQLNAGLVVTSPDERMRKFTCELPCSNNQNEYESLILGLKTLLADGLFCC